MKTKNMKAGTIIWIAVAVVAAYLILAYINKWFPFKPKSPKPSDKPKSGDNAGTAKWLKSNYDYLMANAKDAGVTTDKPRIEDFKTINKYLIGNKKDSADESSFDWLDKISQQVISGKSSSFSAYFDWLANS